MANCAEWIWLQLMFGFGTRRAELMMNYFSHPAELVEGLRCGDRVAGMLEKKELERHSQALQQAQEILRRTQAKGCEVVTPDSPKYPKLLHNIFSRPAALYGKGELECLNEGLAIAMVGTRNLTAYGAQAARALARELAGQGVTVVSGLADGIDAECHSAALAAGGKTVGVLGCGIDVAYPKNSRELKSKMSRQGAVVTEFPLGFEPRPHNFPIRNRIISGMCRGTVVVEADAKSGSLITANCALEQGRDVFAVPGSIFSTRQQGTHLLIREGAKLVETAGDILEEYPGDWRLGSKAEPEADREEGPQDCQRPVEKRNLPDGISREAAELYGCFRLNTLTAEEAGEMTGMKIDQIHVYLTELEIYGMIQGYPGRRFGLK